MKPSRLALAALFMSAAVPAFAQPAADPPSDPVAAALALVAQHRVSTRVGCPIPIPALWNAPPHEQQAAW